MDNFRQPAVPESSAPSMRMLRLRSVMDLTGLRRATIYLAMKRNGFPRPVSLSGGRAVGWVESEVLAYLQAQMRKRDERAAGRAAPASAAG